MKKTTRKITIATVLLCGGLLAGVGLGDMDSAVAYAAEADKFFEVKSVALRVPDGTYGEGIRFTIVMDTDTYGEENVANLTTGILLIPNYALGSDELVVDSDNAAMMKVEGVSWTAEEGVMKMYVHLYNIPDTEYATDISIRAYVDDDDAMTEPLYTDVAVSSVAKAADWLYKNDDLTDEEKATLQETYLTYDVFFHNGTDVTSIKGVYGEKIAAPTVDEREGYTFGGWWNQAETVQWDFDNTTIGGVETNLYAKWNINTYSAKVVRADGTEETVEFTVENREEKLAAIALTANDAQYTYAWATALPSELALNNDQVFTETRTVNNYVVSFNTDGGSAVEAQTVPYGTPASALANFSSEKAGYTFVGWTFEDGSAIPEGATVTENVTVKAKWDIITYSAKVVRANGNEETVNFTVVDRAEKLAAIALTANDAQYTYAWATALPSELALNNDQVFTETRTVNNYTVTFDVDGGSAVEAQTVPYGTPASALSMLTTSKTGYNFVGWTFEDGTAIPENATVQSNLTVKAKWEVQKFAITFVNENGDVLQSEQVAYNTVPTCAVTPVKDSDTYYDYIFAGWTPAVVAVTGEATYTAIFAREIKAELKGNNYTLTELGGGEGIMGSWGNQVLTMKDSMEGTFIYKMAKIGMSGSQIHSFNLFYNGADAGSGVRITFTINGGITINGAYYGMGNVQPNVEYYYLMSWNVADDYSKVTVRIRVEAVDGTSVLGDFIADLNALGGAENIESYVTANNKILIDAQQCDFSVANAWTLDDAAKFVLVKTLNDSIASLTGDETLDELNELKATYTAMDRVYQLMVDNYAALEEAIAKAKEAEEAAVAAIRDNTYTLTELGGGEGIMGMWGNQVLTMKDPMEGTFIYKMTKGGVVGNQIHSFNLFYDGANAGNGVRITFTINGGITINGMYYAMANVQPSVEYYYLMSWKVADDYSKVTMRIRVESTDGTTVLGDFTVELASLIGADSIESWVNTNNKILIDAQQCDFAVANAWNEFNLEKFTVAYNVETAIANLTGDETYNELKAIKAQYDAMDRVYQLMVDNYAAFEPVYNAVVGVVIRDNTYTLTELGGGEGIMGMWGNQVLTMKDSMEGTFIYKMTKVGVVGSQIHSFNLFYNGADAGSGVRITFTINGGITINGAYYGMGNVQPNVEYYYLMSWNVADDYSKVTMRIRVESVDGTAVLGDFTVDLTALGGAESIESYVKANNKILIDAQQCDFSVANAWTELNSATLETVLDLETAIAALTGAESAETLNALKAKYDALDKVYQLMVDNYATLEAMLA